jgi:ferric-dicitrate binding protein FerR (iron transport regulator)
MITDIDNILIIKYLRHELNDAESQQMIDWLQENDENRHFIFGLKDTYMLSCWKELQDKAGTGDGWKALAQTLHESKRSSNKERMYIVLKYTAAAILLFAFSFLMYNIVQSRQPQFNMIKTTSGQMSTLVFDDGTKVILNENSRLIYPKKFNKNMRSVKLLGEAYFEVAHNPSRPFFVNTGNYTVKVLGTKFNVKAYPNQIYSYTSLKVGKVQILDNGKGNKVLSELKPGTQLKYNEKTGKYAVRSIDKDAIANWSLNQVVIKHKTFENIIAILSSKYGYTINLKNSDFGRSTYNITIDNEPLDEILSDIHFITPEMHYSIDTVNKSVTIKERD